MIWYCTHCGRERPEQPGHLRVDDRYTIVICPTIRKTKPKAAPANPTRSAFPDAPVAITLPGVARPGVASQIEAKRIVKERRAAAARRRELRRILWSGKTEPKPVKA